MAAGPARAVDRVNADIVGAGVTSVGHPRSWDWALRRHRASRVLRAEGGTHERETIAVDRRNTPGVIGVQ